jgi:predicted TIM-barrel fold metal-dependent hydrolase
VDNWTRREFLAGLGGAAAGALVASSDGMAQTSRNGYVDMHHHFGPPQWRSYLSAKNLLVPDWNAWTPDRSIEELDRAGVAAALSSITYPGIWLPQYSDPVDKTRGLARDCNEYGAKMVADHPGRFGLMAVLPLPDVDGSLREVEYALGTLKADGVGVLTSYGDRWIGDAAFSPVLEELNRRKAVVFTHPNVPVCCTRGGTGSQRYLVPGVNNNVIEYATDTTRAIMSLVVAKVSERYPNLRFTFSHGGGTMPFLIERILGYEDLEKQLASPAPPKTRLYELRQFYYDSANANNSVAMGALKKVVGVSQVLLGTDFPYGSENGGAGLLRQHVNDLKGCGAFNAQEIQAVCRDNALRVLPRLKS